MSRALSVEGLSQPADGPGQDRITWEVNIPFLSNPLVLKQTALTAGGAGLFMGVLMSVILAARGEFEAVPRLWLISILAAGGLGLAMVLIMLVIFGGRIRVRFTLDEDGVLRETVDRTAQAGNRIAMATGLLGGSPGLGGAGAKAAAREEAFVPWGDLASLDESRWQHMIVLRDHWQPLAMLVCPPENYDPVLSLVRRRIPEGPSDGEARRSPLGRALFTSAAVVAAAAPLFVLSSSALDLDLLLPLIALTFGLAAVWLVPLFAWVVMGCVAILAVLVGAAGASDFAVLDGGERIALYLTYVSLAYLLWFALHAARGRYVPPLQER